LEDKILYLRDKDYLNQMSFISQKTPTPSFGKQKAIQILKEEIPITDQIIKDYNALYEELQNITGDLNQSQITHLK